MILEQTVIHYHTLPHTATLGHARMHTVIHFKTAKHCNAIPCIILPHTITLRHLSARKHTCTGRNSRTRPVDAWIDFFLSHTHYKTQGLDYIVVQYLPHTHMQYTHVHRAQGPAPHRTTQYHPAPPSTNRHHPALPSTTQHHTAPHCTKLHHTAPHCTSLHHIAPLCTSLDHTAPH